MSKGPLAMHWGSLFNKTVQVRKFLMMVRTVEGLSPAEREQFLGQTAAFFGLFPAAWAMWGAYGAGGGGGYMTR